MQQTTKKQVVVLYGQHGAVFTQLWAALKKEIAPYQKEAFELKAAPLRSLIFSFGPNEASITAPAYGIDLQAADLVILRSANGGYDFMAACAQFLDKHRIPYFDAVRATSGRGGKLNDAEVCWLVGLPFPRTIVASNENLEAILTAASSPLSFPFILKDMYGSQGDSNYLIKDSTALKKALRAHPALTFAAQEYIPNTGDYRFVVYGDKIALAFRRQAQDGGHLNNISKGGKGTLVPPDSFAPQVLQDVLAAARAKNVQIAGVDVLFDERTNQHYILEINLTPQLAGGAFSAEHMQGLAALIRETLHAAAPSGDQRPGSVQ